MKSANAPHDRPPKQQSIERHYFEMFRKNTSLPSGAVIYGDKPDVILKGAQKIGIEMTNVYVTDGASPRTEQVQRQRRAAAIAKGHDLYQQNAGKNIQLTFSFDESRPIQDVDALAKQLAALARHIEEQDTEDQDNGQITREVFEDIPEIELVYVSAPEPQNRAEPGLMFPESRPDPSKRSAAHATCRNRREERAPRESIYKPVQPAATWKLAQSHSFGPMSAERLTEIIREKETQARQYATCDIYWLLIVVEFLDSQQEQELRMDGVTAESDVFQRIVVYSPKFEHILEVIPRRRATAEGNAQSGKRLTGTDLAL